MAESKISEWQERHVVSFPRVAMISLGLIILLVAVSLVLSGLGETLNTPETKSNVLVLAATASPTITLGEELKQLRATEEATLTTYGWADRPNGIVHIPIDRAMDLVLQRGLPHR